MRLTRVKQNDLVWENMSQDYFIDLVTVIQVFESHLIKYTSLVLLKSKLLQSFTSFSARLL